MNSRGSLHVSRIGAELELARQRMKIFSKLIQTSAK
jgi:hypothetical protein